MIDYTIALELTMPVTAGVDAGAVDGGCENIDTGGAWRKLFVCLLSNCKAHTKASVSIVLATRTLVHGTVCAHLCEHMLGGWLCVSVCSC